MLVILRTFVIRGWRPPDQIEGLVSVPVQSQPAWSKAGRLVWRGVEMARMDG